MLRLSAPVGTRLEAAPRLNLSVAGSECNVAADLAGLGVTAAWISKLPNSQIGRRVVNELAALGVDVAHVLWVDDARLGLFFVEAGANPRPTSVLYDRAASAFASIEPDQLDLSPLDGALWAVISGITPALGDAATRTALALMRAASERGVKTCVDVNYRSRLWRPARAREGLVPLLAQARLVICAQRDAREVFGLAESEASLIDGLRRLSPNAELIVVTEQERGGIAAAGDGTRIRFQSVPATVVDPLGVGDAFLAGLLSGLIDDDLDSALERAAAMAAYKCTITGDFARASIEDLQAVTLGLDKAVLR
jgi:2-dehydro-3-deoxygluconokinase